MSAFLSPFEAALPQIVAPPRVVPLQVSAFLSTYDGRPEVDIEVGLRLPSQEDAEGIESEALKALSAVTSGNEQEAIRAYNQSKLVNLVALCICSPIDVNAPHELFPAPNSVLPIALTPQALVYLFDCIERLQIDVSPIFAEASDEEVATLAEILSTPALRDLRESDPVNAGRVRRYLNFCLELLTQ
jgi:hypothetical protein